MSPTEPRRPYVVAVPKPAHNHRGLACAWATKADAERLAAEAGGELTGETTGYPFSPRLDDGDGWGAGQFPSFCLRPGSCRGTGSCTNPFGRSCTS